MKKEFTTMGGACIVLVCLLNTSTIAAIAEQLDSLPDGEYIYSSQLPKIDQHPQIQLAGAEIYAFTKRGKAVLGEQFIANTSEANCFKGTLKNSTIQGKIFIPIQGKSTLQGLQMRVDLALFYPISRSSIPYAENSVQRCQRILPKSHR